MWNNPYRNVFLTLLDDWEAKIAKITKIAKIATPLDWTR